MYSFNKHQRLDHTTSIYSPHVLVLEGIFALYDPRVLELIDMGARRVFFCILKPLANSLIRFTAKQMLILAYHEEVSFAPEF